MIGPAIALLAALGYAIGIAIEQRALRRMPPVGVRRAAAFARALLSSPGWLLGFVLTLGGLGCQIIALAYAPISVVQPVYFTALTLLLMFIEHFSGQRIASRAWAALALMLVSLLALSLSIGAHPGIGRGGTPVTVIAVTGVSVVVGIAAARVVGVLARGRSAAGLSHAVAAGLLYGVAGLQAKGMSELLARYHLRGVVQAGLTSPYPYLLVITSLLGMGLFQTALQRGRASVVAPVQNVVGNVYLVLVGSVLFGEHLPTDPLRLVLRVVGFVLGIGVVFVVPYHDREVTAHRAAQPRPVTGAADPAYRPRHVR